MGGALRVRAPGAPERTARRGRTRTWPIWAEGSPQSAKSAAQATRLSAPAAQLSISTQSRGKTRESTQRQRPTDAEHQPKRGAHLRDPIIAHKRDGATAVKQPPTHMETNTCGRCLTADDPTRYPPAPQGHASQKRQERPTQKPVRRTARPGWYARVLRPPVHAPDFGA